MRINHSEEAAKKAQDYYVKTRQEKEVPDEVEPSPAPPEISLIDFMVKYDLATSKGDARRKIEQGGVGIDGERIKDPSYELSETDNGKIIKVGKFHFRKIVIE